MVLYGLAMKVARLSLSPCLSRSIIPSSPSTIGSALPFLKDRAFSCAPNRLHRSCPQLPILDSDVSSPLPLLPSLQARCRLYPINGTSSNQGVGGAYLIKDGDQPAAVFKPLDEEAVPDEQEEVYVGKEIKPGLLYGEGYLKEIAAYLLDREHFHGVPPTMLFCVKNPVIQDTESKGPKVGSLQQYVSHSCTADEVGWNSFPVDEVHKIGILDCRLMNNDRHLGNILVVKENNSRGFSSPSFSPRSGNGCRLIPIDHGLSLPSSLSGAYFEWLSFPQCKQPFSKAMLAHIESINVEADIQMLEKHLPSLRRECLDTLRISTMFLQKAAKAGLNLFEIGCLMSRYRDMEEECVLEKLCENVNEQERAIECVEGEGKEDEAAKSVMYWATLSKAMDTILYNYCNNNNLNM